MPNLKDTNLFKKCFYNFDNFIIIIVSLLVESTVNCSDSTGNEPVIENTNVTFYCDMEYQGFYPPTLMWLDQYGAELPVTDSELLVEAGGERIVDHSAIPKDQLVKLRSVLIKTLTAKDDGIYFQCTMSFGSVPTNDDDRIYATNSPLYSGETQDSTSQIQVLCKLCAFYFILFHSYIVKFRIVNIVILCINMILFASDTPRDVIKTPPNVLVHNPGDTLTCEGDSNPALSKIVWINEATSMYTSVKQYVR